MKILSFDFILCSTQFFQYIRNVTSSRTCDVTAEIYAALLEWNSNCLEMLNTIP